MGLIYLDSCLLIYVVENRQPWAATVRQALEREREAEFVISPLVKAECLVGPLRRNDTALAARHRRYFARFQTAPISEAAFLAAANIRARHGLKLPDALHFACAEEHGCDALWTNDNRLSGAGSIAVALGAGS